MFYNELNMLEFRLTELSDVVDYFVLVESNKTFAGNNKNLIFQENKDRFSKWSNKIIHIVTPETLSTNNPWDREFYQRNCITLGLQKLNLSDSDIVIINDVDEIPDSNTLRRIKNSNVTGLYSLVQDWYWYNITCRFKNTPWFGSKFGTYSIIKNMTPQQVRERIDLPRIASGGWHFSYFGGVDFIVNKLENFSHQEHNTDFHKNRESIEQHIKTQSNKIYLGDNYPMMEIKTENNLYLPNNYKMLL